MNIQKSHLSLLSALESVSKKTKHVDVVFRARVPESKKTKDPVRKPIAVAIVIDHSGSMHGHPLDKAKKAAVELISRLQPGDHASVVSYGSQTIIHSALVEATLNKEALVNAVGSIQCEGNTLLRDGWLTGAQTLAATVSKFAISRVLLLSDGVSTDGSNSENVVPETSALAEKGISTSTYGLGLRFNEDLMTALAVHGDGSAFYAEEAETLVEYFESEFKMLNATVGNRVSLTVKATVEHGGKTETLDVKALKDFSLTSKFVLGNLLEGSDRWTAFRIELPEAFMKKANEIQINAEFKYTELDGKTNSHVQTLHLESTIPVSSKKEVESKNDWALERIKEVNAARLQQEALKEARQGNWMAAQSLVDSIGASAGNNAYVSSVAASLGALAANRDVQAFSKEASYSSVSMSSRMVDANEDVASMNVSNDRYGLRKSQQGKSQG